MNVYYFSVVVPPVAPTVLTVVYTYVVAARDKEEAMFVIRESEKDAIVKERISASKKIPSNILGASSDAKEPRVINKDICGVI